MKDFCTLLPVKITNYEAMFIIVIFGIHSLYGHAQNILTGIVVNAENNKPVPYTSIGVVRTPNGTISNDAADSVLF